MSKQNEIKVVDLRPYYTAIQQHYHQIASATPPGDQRPWLLSKVDTMNVLRTITTSYVSEYLQYEHAVDIIHALVPYLSPHYRDGSQVEKWLSTEPFRSIYESIGDDVFRMIGGDDGGWRLTSIYMNSSSVYLHQREDFRIAEFKTNAPVHETCPIGEFVFSDLIGHLINPNNPESPLHRAILDGLGADELVRVILHGTFGPQMFPISNEFYDDFVSCSGFSPVDYYHRYIARLSGAECIANVGRMLATSPPYSRYDIDVDRHGTVQVYEVSKDPFQLERTLRELQECATQGGYLPRSDIELLRKHNRLPVGW